MIGKGSVKKGLKLNMSSSVLNNVSEIQSPSFPSECILAFPVQSSNRFKCLSSKPVDRQLPLSRPSFQPPTSKEECPKSRVEFYQNFSQLIKLGNVDKQGDIPSKTNVEKQEETCTRQLSKEDSLWQSELKEVIWLELQAWHAGRTVKERDDYLVEARKNIDGMLADIMNYRFKKRPDQMSRESNDSGIDLNLSPDVNYFAAAPVFSHGEESNTCPDHTCLSLFCPLCLEGQNCALRDIEYLLQRLDEAEGWFPSSKAFAEQYPLYNSPKFKALVKTMFLWRNMLIWHRMKVIFIAKRILLFVNLKGQNGSRHSSTTTSSSNSEDSVFRLCLNDLRRNNTKDYYNTQPLVNAAKFLKSLKTEDSRVYREFIENLLKSQGLRKALNFLELIQLSCLHKGNLSLQKSSVEEDVRFNQTSSDFELSEEEEIKRFGFWSPETQAMGLPSYRACYLFLARVPLDIIHEFLHMRLETKPKQPSNLSIIQLIRELKDGLSLAVVSRERYLSHIKTSLWDLEPDIFDDYKSSISDYDTSVQSILELYLDYLQQWVQMTHQERVQKNILREEWTFINTVTPHIPEGQASVGNCFCEMTSLLLRGIRKQFENSFTICQAKIENETDSFTKLEKLAICRELQLLCTETRLRALSAIALAKTLRKDLEKDESIKMDDNSKMIIKSLCQLKIEALKMCDLLLNIVISLDQMTDILKDWGSRLREVVHQFFKFGFEYQKYVCWLVTSDFHAELSRRLITFAQQWMVFAKERCERGRGLRPRWAHHGFDFLMTVCESRFTNCLTDDEFEEFKRNIDECIFHVIGTSVPNHQAKTKKPISYYTRPRELISPESNLPKQIRRTSSSTSDNSPSSSTEPESPIFSNLSKRERMLESIFKLDDTLESKLKERELIGKVVSVELHDSERNFIRPRSVKFHWQRGIKIGQGRFGKVYTAVNNETGELMAMKEIALQPNDHRTIRSVALELKIFEGIQHENLVRYYGVEIHREEMLIFMELCTEGMLESLVASTQSGLPEGLVRRFTYQLVTAVNTLHSHCIVHRDIKSANIFLTEGGNCLKLGDFGSAVKIRSHTTVAGELQGFVGTQAYMAPEVFMKTNQEGHGRSVDVWSLGCVLVEMGSGKRPWADFDSNYQIMFKVGMGEIPAIPETLSEEGQHFASLCFIHDPKERTTTTELLNHTFLAVDSDKEHPYFDIAFDTGKLLKI